MTKRCATARCREARRGEAGFTLIELLVVIIILGVLSAVVVFAVRGSGDKGQSAAKTIDERTLRTAQEAFCANKGHYASTQQALVDERLLSEKSTVNDISVSTGSCGDGSKGPSGYGVVGGVVPSTLKLTGGTVGYPSPFSYNRGGHYLQMFNLYDSLLWKDASGALVPWLASSVPAATNGGTRYTFDLRPGVKWHDFASVPAADQTLDADDVKFTFDYYKSRAAFPGRIASGVIAPPLTTITSVNVIGPLKVEFNLSAPAATFLQFGAAGGVPIAPARIWGPDTDSGCSETGTPGGTPGRCIADPQSVTTDRTKLVGTGPYTLAGTGPYSNSSTNYEFNAFDGYFLGAPKVKKITQITQANDLTALTNGDVHSAGASGRPSLIDPYKKNAAYRVLQAPPGSSVTQLNFNHSVAPFNNLSFRRAVAMAVDRQAMVNTLFGDAGGPGNGVPGNPGWIPPENTFYEPAAQQYPFSPASVAAANALLDSAYPRDPADTGDGAPPGGWRHLGPTGPRLDYPLTQASGSTALADLLPPFLKAIGVRLTVTQVTDLPARINAGAASTLGMYLIGSGGVNSDLGVDYLRLVYRSTAKLQQRALNYNNSSLDTKLDNQLSALDVPTRKQIASDAQKQIADDVPLLPLVFPFSYTISRRAAFDKWYYTPGGVAGVVPSVLNKLVFITGQQVGGLP